MLAKFEMYFDGEYWCARGIGADVFTQGKTVDELMGNIREAAALHFEEGIISPFPITRKWPKER